MWGGGLCGTHKTLVAAITSALKCERAGGEPHDIFRVTKMKRPPKAKRCQGAVRGHVS